MNIDLKYPFPEINVTVDCDGGRREAPRVNIAIVNGAIDAKKSDVKITGEYHLHPFQSEMPVDYFLEVIRRSLRACEKAGVVYRQPALVDSLKSCQSIYGFLAAAASEMERDSEKPLPPVIPTPLKVGDSEEDDMAASIIVGVFQAASKVMWNQGQENISVCFTEFANDRKFCTAVGHQVMEDAK